MKLLGKYRNTREMFENEDRKTLEKMFPHGKPMSRRDLLKSGAIPFAASFTFPSIVNVLANAGIAQAAEACATGGPRYIGLNAAGGYAPLSNYIPLTEGRDLAPDYSVLGHGSGADAAANMTKEFGGSTWAVYSPLLAGIKAVALPATLEKTAMFIIPVQTQDDSGNNPADPTGFMHKLNVTGSILGPIGTAQNLTGIGQMPAMGVAPPTPLSVGSTNDISNALGVAGSLSLLNENQKGKLFSLIDRLSSGQARSLASSTGGSVLGELVSSATGQNVKLVSSRDNGTDPLRDPIVGTDFNRIWTNANNQPLQNQNNTREAVFATMVYNSLKGNCGTANLNIGGYDYHQTGRVNQRNKDTELGRTIGAILESNQSLGAVTGSPVMLAVYTDGATGAPQGSVADSEQTADRGAGGCYLVFVHDPKGRPNTLNQAGQDDHQVGHIVTRNNGQAADTSTLTGGDPNKAALAIVANFCALGGNVGNFFNVSGNVWNQDQVNQVVRISRVG